MSESSAVVILPYLYKFLQVFRVKVYHLLMLPSNLMVYEDMRVEDFMSVLEKLFPTPFSSILDL